MAEHVNLKKGKILFPQGCQLVTALVDLKAVWHLARLEGGRLNEGIQTLMPCVDRSQASSVVMNGSICLFVSRLMSTHVHAECKQ